MSQFVYILYGLLLSEVLVINIHQVSYSLGNHEFDNGVSGVTPFIEHLTCPVLAANLDLSKVPELKIETNLRKSVIFNISGTQVGVIGYLTPDTKVLAVPNDVEYIQEIDALKDEVAKMRNQSVNIIIALGHSGFIRDLEIAKWVDGLDLVIGGHSNTFLWNGSSPDAEVIQGSYPTYVTQPSGRQVPVVQAYAYTKYLGKLKMLFDSKGEIISIEGQPILLDNTIPQDPDVLKIVDRYRTQILNITEEVVGNTSVVLDGLNCQFKECNLGNLITDAMVYRYASEYKGDPAKGNHWTDASIAVIQGGGIRSSIAAAHMPMSITKGDLIGVMPFAGHMVVVRMNGSVLIQMLEHAVANYNLLDYPGEFLQVSGLKVVYDIRRPSGQRVAKVVARCWNCTIPEYNEVKKDEYYNVITISFLSNGGDGYSMLKGLPTKMLDYNELASTQQYVKHHSPVFPEVEGRVVLIDENTKDSSTNNLTPPLFLSIISLISLRMT